MPQTKSHLHQIHHLKKVFNSWVLGGCQTQNQDQE